MAIEELIVPQDFTIRLRLQREEQEDLIIEENGLDLKFDILIAMRNSPSTDMYWVYMASYLTNRWKEQLGELTISKAAALDIWNKCNTKATTLKKTSDSTPKS